MTAKNSLDSRFEWTKFLKGKVEILQPSRGARFSIDSVILSAFSFVREGETVVDLGCGTGIIMLLISNFFHPKKIVGIEIQDDFCFCANETMAKSGFPDFEVIKSDIRECPKEKFDVVVSNPPFYEAKKGRTSPDFAKRISRQREDLELDNFFESARNYMKDEGRLSFILPYSTKQEAFSSLKKSGLSPYILREVKHKEGNPPKRFLCLCSKKELPLVELPPLTIKNENDQFNDEIKPFLGEIPLREEFSFFCDSMLYRLAKYLRFSGIDAAYLKDADDDWLLRECQRSGRTLISLDRELICRFQKKKLKCFEPSSFSPKEQYLETIEKFSLKESNPRRCLKCNTKVIKIEKEKIEGMVPEFTYKTHKDFYVCPSCSKITWGGTHLERFRKEVLENIELGEKI
ncbi:MAG: Mut7-C RNAse domain-containing protein [Acidobacteriota bacterium]